MRMLPRRRRDRERARERGGRVVRVLLRSSRVAREQERERVVRVGAGFRAPSRSSAPRRSGTRASAARCPRLPIARGSSRRARSTTKNDGSTCAGNAAAAARVLIFFDVEREPHDVVGERRVVEHERAHRLARVAPHGGRVDEERHARLLRLGERARVVVFDPRGRERRPGAAASRSAWRTRSRSRPAPAAQARRRQRARRGGTRASSHPCMRIAARSTTRRARRRGASRRRTCASRGARCRSTKRPSSRVTALRERHGTLHLDSPVERGLELVDHLADALEARRGSLREAAFDEVEVLGGRRPLVALVIIVERDAGGASLWMAREHRREALGLAEVVLQRDELVEEDRTRSRCRCARRSSRPRRAPARATCTRACRRSRRGAW